MKLSILLEFVKVKDLVVLSEDLESNFYKEKLIEAEEKLLVLGLGIQQE